MTPEPEPNPTVNHPILGGSRRARLRSPSVQTRDFRRPPPPSRTEQNELVGLCSRCGQWIQSFFSNQQRRTIAVVPEPVQTLPYSSFAAQMPDASWPLPLKGPAGQRAVLMLDRAAQEWLLLLMLGGGARPVAQAAPVVEGEVVPDPVLAPIGPISRGALRPVLETLLKQRSFVSLGGGEGGFVPDDEREKAPRARLMRSNDVVTSFTYKIRDGERVSSLSLLFMHRTLAPHLSAPDREHRAEPDPSVRKRLESTVRSVTADTTVVLGAAQIELTEFLRLEPGDVLVLDRRVGEPLEVVMGGRPLFLGHPGRSGGRLAVRLSARIENKELS